MSVRVRTSLLLALLALSLPACGGSSKDDDDFLTLTAFLGPEGGFEGTIDAAGTIAEAAGGLGVGDREGQVPAGPVRAFLSFDLTPIPAFATITRARLHCDQAFVAGAPFTSLGSVVVDHMNWGATFPAPATYGANALLGNIMTLSNSATLGTRSGSVLIAVNADRAASRTRSQFRLRMSNADQNFDGQNTFVRFVDSEGSGGLGGVPLLEITYTIPN
jgi:hypothetical protein